MCPVDYRTPETGLLREEALARITEALSLLPAREESVIRLSFGLHGAQDVSLPCRLIGEIFGVTTTRAQQLLSRGLRRLRRRPFGRKFLPTIADLGP